MTLRVVGAGLPRTGTGSLTIALEHLLGRRVHHMSTIPGHPFDLGSGWNQALADQTPDNICPPHINPTTIPVSHRI